MGTDAEAAGACACGGGGGVGGAGGACTTAAAGGGTPLGFGDDGFRGGGGGAPLGFGGPALVLSRLASSSSSKASRIARSLLEGGRPRCAHSARSSASSSTS